MGQIMEQEDGLIEGRGCEDKYLVKMVTEKYLAWGKKLFSAIMDLK